MDRRRFVKIIGAGAAATAIPWRFDLKRGLRSTEALAFVQSAGLTKFVDQLPQFNAQIPLAFSDGTRSWLGPPAKTATHYSIDIGQFQQVCHSDFITPGKPAYIANFAGTTFWGYGQGTTFTHLGGAILATSGTPVQITFTNKLVTAANKPLASIIPVDTTLTGGNANTNRTAVHLHGGFIPWISDGGPYDWFDPFGNSGLSFQNGPGSVLDPTKALSAGQAEYYYGNDQSARMMWYHDHAYGITRTNAYAGVATGYLITDSQETGVLAPFLPTIGTAVGVPLVIQDKIFVPNNILAVDPTWAAVVPPIAQTAGNLWYAHVYDPSRWKLFKGKNTLPPPDPSCIPEFFGDTMLMNGNAYPFMEVPAQRVRFRVLNACNARFVNLQLFVDDGTADGITLNKKTLLPTNPAGPPIIQIGSEGGFLPAPVVFKPPTTPFNALTFNGTVLLAPAERADIIIDFSTLPNNTKIIMYNDAPAPFPIGDPRNDYFPGAPQNPTITTPGSSPNTRQIMQFRVNTLLGTGTADFTAYLAGLTTALATAYAASQPPPLWPVPPTTVPPTPPTIPTAAQVSRILTLNEAFDGYGRLIQTIGTNIPNPNGTFGLAYTAPPTEMIRAGATEIWQLCNLTGDTHPLHFHLVNMQIIARQTFNVKKFTGMPLLTGVPRGPDPNEAGWKETIRMNPGEVIWVIAKFDLPTPPFVVPPSNRLLSMGITGNEYVYHCHILEHEEHDMMRPLVVT
jgi:spore coat protein A, manganese oxidase